MRVCVWLCICICVCVWERGRTWWLAELNYFIVVSRVRRAYWLAGVDWRSRTSLRGGPARSSAWPSVAALHLLGRLATTLSRPPSLRVDGPGGRTVRTVRHREARSSLRGSPPSGQHAFWVGASRVHVSSVRAPRPSSDAQGLPFMLTRNCCKDGPESHYEGRQRWPPPPLRCRVQLHPDPEGVCWWW